MQPSSDSLASDRVGPMELIGLVVAVLGVVALLAALVPQVVRGVLWRRESNPILRGELEKDQIESLWIWTQALRDPEKPEAGS